MYINTKCVVIKWENVGDGAGRQKKDIRLRQAYFLAIGKKTQGEKNSKLKKKLKLKHKTQFFGIFKKMCV